MHDLFELLFLAFRASARDDVFFFFLSTAAAVISTVDQKDFYRRTCIRVRASEVCCLHQRLLCYYWLYLQSWRCFGREKKNENLFSTLYARLQLLLRS